CVPERRAVASSPNSSVSQRNVAASPRAASLAPYIARIVRCKPRSVTPLSSDSPMPPILPDPHAPTRGVSDHQPNPRDEPTRLASFARGQTKPILTQLMSAHRFTNGIRPVELASFGQKTAVFRRVPPRNAIFNRIAKEPGAHRLVLRRSAN